MPVEILRK